MFDKNKSINKILLLLAGILLIAFSFSSCDFAYKKHVVGKYYIIAVDDETDMGLSYQLGSGNYIGKAPGRILEYGYNDTFLIAKTQEYSEAYPTYYIIDMTKDSELAHEETFRIGPLTESDFNRIWKPKLKLHMTKLN